jgi:hypothetical protein
MRDMMAQIRDVGDGIRDGTYTMTAPKITGGTITGATINNSAIGGTTAAAGKFTTLEATGVTTVQAGTVSAPAITTSGDTNTGIFFPAADTIAFAEGGAEAMRITSGGDVGIGTTAPIKPLSVEITSARSATTDNEAIRVSYGTNSGVQQSVSIGFATSVSNTYPAAKIELLEFDAVDARGSLLFYTRSANSDSAPTERMRITDGGTVLIGTTSADFTDVGIEFYATGGAQMTRSDGLVLAINRLTSDGNLVEFYQASTLEGNISVSGSTVSYNGGHLSRWSQLPDGSKDDTILKGTVLTNLDDMCVWEKDGVVAENEQLNKMQVSNVEGDTNVAGVFVNWTRDEDCNSDDMNIAMTGDMIIRIAQNVVVQKGDLLMSAGDGTAKPQGDDIVRSKTIAKVTSNHVTCTYEDGSYCVPCVLMAC